MDLDQLNPRSRRVARALLAEFPDWAPYLRLSAFPGHAPGTLEVEVPPAHLAGSPLHVDTDNDEVTVSFADWHEHYGGWAGDVEEESIRAAVQAVRDVVEERLLSVLALDDGRPRRAWRAAPGEPVTTRHGTLTRVRSWRGTYDAEMARP